MGPRNLLDRVLPVESLQRRRRRVDFALRRSECYDDGTQLQQEVFTLKAQVARRIWTRGCSASYPQSRECPVSEGYSEPHRREGLRSSARIFAKKTEYFFAGEMMLEWAAEQGTEITRKAVDLEFLPTVTNLERGDQNLEFGCSRCTRCRWRSRAMKPTTLSPTRGRIHWKLGDDHRNDTILRQEEENEEENETSCVRSFLQEVALSWNSKRASSDGSPMCRATRRS